MRLIKDTHYDFIGKRKAAFWISVSLIVVGLASIVVRGGIRMGVDFTGGVQVEVGIRQEGETPVGIADVRKAVAAAGYDNRNIQRLGGRTVNTFLIHFQSTSSGEAVTGDEITGESTTTSTQILTALQAEFGEDRVELRSVESVGPKIGGELRRAALEAVLLAMLLVVAYVAWRFDNFRYGVATLVAVIHDVLLTLGLFSLFNKEITLSIIAALLTLVGYSVNDTIVVFDRIREELKKKQRRESLEDIFNTGINLTLSRTLLTSLTTLFVLASLFIYGGSVIHDFAWVLFVGIIVGTYSSIFVAAPLVTEWQKRQALREAQKAA